MVAFLIHLAEFDRRRGWEALNYPGLWEFCERELKLQKSCVYRRTNAARLIQRFPGAIERLRCGALTMTTLVVLKDVLTELNVEDVLSRAEWKSKDEVKALAAELAPKPEPKPMIRMLPVAPAMTVSPEVVDEPTNQSTIDAVMSGAISTATPPAETRSSARAVIETTALDGVRYSFRGVANKDFTDKLRRAQEILSHAVPNGDPIQVLERALDALLEKHAKTLVEPRERASKAAAPLRKRGGKESPVPQAQSSSSN